MNESINQSINQSVKFLLHRNFTKYIQGAA